MSHRCPSRIPSPRIHGCRALLALSVALAIPPRAPGEEAAEVFVQIGHTDDVRCVAFSPDGQQFVSGGDDGTLKLWDVASGREIRTLSATKAPVTNVAFSPDGKQVLSCIAGPGILEFTADLWDIASARVAARLGGHQGTILSLGFSKDGKHVFTAGADKNIKQWNAATGEEVRTFSGHTGSVNSLAVSPDGKRILTGSEDKTIKLWDVATGDALRTLTGHTQAVCCVSYARDGQTAVSGSRDQTLRLWDLKSGDALRTLEESAATEPCLAVSPDSRLALYGGDGDEDGKGSGRIRLWDIVEGQRLRNFEDRGARTRCVSFSPDGKHALSGDTEGVIQMWDVATGKPLRKFTSIAESTESAAVSPDGSILLIGSHDSLMASGRHHNLRVWDLAAGREIRTVHGHEKWISSIAFQPQGRRMVSSSIDKTLRVWDTADWKEVQTLSGHEAGVTSVDISADGTQALSGSLDGAMILWDLASGRKLHAFPAQPSQVNAVAISPDGSTAISGGGYPFRWKQTLSLWDLAKRTKGWSADDASTVNSVVFSSDGRKAFTGHGDIIDRQWLVRRWDILTGKWEWSSTGHEYPVLSVALAKDGKHVLSGSMDGTLRLWDAGNGQEVRAFRGHRGGVASASFSPDGRYAISTGLDSTVRWWDIATAREIVQFVEFQNGEWIAITPEGYYNSSANGDHHINVRVGNQVFGIDQYRSTFYRPDVVQAALDLGDSARAIAAVLGDSAQRPTLATAQKIEPPFVVIKSPDEGQNLATAHALLSLYIEDRNQKVNSVRVFVNGRKVTGQDQRGVQVVSREQIPEMDASGIRIPEGKNQIDLKIPLALDPGPNRIEVTVSNGFSEGRKSITVHSAAVAATEAGTRLLPNLWILSIGINQYQTATFRPLAFAVADAEGIVQAFQKQQGRLFKEVHSLLITDRSEVKPTFESVMDNLKFLSRAGHNDVVLLFLAGHGVTDDRGQFYFLPSDAMFDEDGSIKRSKAVSWREIHQALDLPSRKLIFADTCHSEGLAGKRTRSVDSDRFVKELQDANAVIFTSSRGNELSQEQEVWGHGAFTYALLQGLDGKADLIKDRKISMKELDAYVSETVPQLTKGAQHPITNTPEGYVDFPVTLTE